MTNRNQLIANVIKEILVDEYAKNPEDRDWTNVFGNLIDDLEGVNKNPVYLKEKQS